MLCSRRGSREGRRKTEERQTKAARKKRKWGVGEVSEVKVGSE